MKMEPKKIMIFGLIFFIVSIIGAILSFYVIIEDPGEVAVETLYFNEPDEDYSLFFNPIDNSSDLSETVYLDKGDYEIWYDAEFFGLGGPRELTIHDSDGNLVYRKSSIFGGSDSISRNGKEYRKYCSFEIEKTGNYLITVDDPSTLYITPPLHLGLGVGLGYMFVILGIISVITMIVGAGLYFTKVKKPSDTAQPPGQPTSTTPGQYPQYPYYPGYSGYPGYNYPPPPPPPHSQQPEDKSGDSEMKSQSKPTTEKLKTKSKPTLQKTTPPSTNSDHPYPYPTPEPPPYPPPYNPPQQTPYPYYYYPYYNYDPYYYYYNPPYSKPYYHSHDEG